MKGFHLDGGLIQISELKKKSEETFCRIDKENRPLAIISNGDVKAVVMSVKEYYRQLNQFKKLQEKLRNLEKFPNQFDEFISNKSETSNDNKTEANDTSKSLNSSGEGSKGFINKNCKDSELEQK